MKIPAIYEASRQRYFTIRDSYVRTRRLN